MAIGNNKIKQEPAHPHTYDGAHVGLRRIQSMTDEEKEDGKTGQHMHSGRSLCSYLLQITHVGNIMHACRGKGRCGRIGEK